MSKSYFAILGVRSSASPEEIRSAYRKLAKEYHPDHFDGGSNQFRKIEEAYSVLGDAEKRREYKQSIQETAAEKPVWPRHRSAPEPLIPEHGPADLGEISPIRSFRTFRPSYDEIFDHFFDEFSGFRRAKSDRIHNMTLEVPLTREQAVLGGSARIMVPTRGRCPRCRGGGNIGPYECTQCAGQGVVAGEVPISVDFPAGLTRDHAVVIPLNRLGLRDLHLTVLFRPTDG